MKIKTAEGAALIVASVVSFLSVGGAAIDYFFAGGPWEWYYISYAGGVFVAGYFVSRWAIRKFIAFRIKPIYEMALSRDIAIRELESQFVANDRVIEDIGDEVSHWVESSKEEINRLQANEAFRREFIGDVSHELKTPIFNIQGYVSTLLAGAIDDPAVNREYLQRAEKNINRLVNTVTDLDMINKVEAGTLELRKTNFNIVPFTNEIVYALKYQADKRNITITVQKSDIPITVHADKKYIERVLINLITNSIRYGNEGGRTSITFIDMFEKIGVQVSDNGIGISKEHMPHIFGRFFRADKSRSREQGGTGLGLAIVKHIINAHEEGIIVRSTLGVGSTFTFTLQKTAEPEIGRSF